MNEEIKKRLENVKQILRSIVKNFPKEVDFLFVNVDPNDTSRIIDYCYSLNSDNGVESFKLITDIAIQDLIIQRHYKNLAETNQALIVCCVHDADIPENIIPLQQGRFYKVTSISNVNEDGDVFYELEYLDNSKLKHTGYNSKRFVRLCSKNLYN